jgi:hypothetical protein
MRDPRCLRMTFGGFPGLEIQKTQEMMMPIRLLAPDHLQGEGDAKSSHS